MRGRAACHTKLIPIVKHSMNSNWAARCVSYSLVGSMKSGIDAPRSARDPKCSRKAAFTFWVPNLSRATSRKSVSTEYPTQSSTSSAFRVIFILSITSCRFLPKRRRAARGNYISPQQRKELGGAPCVWCLIRLRCSRCTSGRPRGAAPQRGTFRILLRLFRGKSPDKG